MVSDTDFVVNEWLHGYGGVEIVSNVSPPSLQSKSATKREFKAALAAAVERQTTRVFIHDVRITVTWVVEERRRYETHIVADLDNILKPSIDALTGPTGVLLDDNQVQSIDASWRSWGTEVLKIRVESLLPGEYVLRGGRIVEVRPNRCFYLPPLPHAHEAILIKALSDQLTCVERLVKIGVSPAVAAQGGPTMRSFPRARLGKFEIFKFDEVV